MLKSLMFAVSCAVAFSVNAEPVVSHDDLNNDTVLSMDYDMDFAEDYCDRYYCPPPEQPKPKDKKQKK